MFFFWLAGFVEISSILNGIEVGVLKYGSKKVF